MKENLPRFLKAKYIDIQSEWRKLGPIFRSVEAEKIWRPCMVEYSTWRAQDFGHEWKPRRPINIPAHHDSCDWRYTRKRRGPMPSFWDYACHSACHWVADLALFVATQGHPEQPWRIQTSRHHTTVWNGNRNKPTLFDINFLALGVWAEEALRIACRGRELKPGVYLKKYLHA